MNLSKLVALFTPKHAETLAKLPSIEQDLYGWCGGLTDAFELGRTVGYAECAKEVRAALDEPDPTPSLVVPQDLPVRPGALSGFAGPTRRKLYRRKKLSRR